MKKILKNDHVKVILVMLAGVFYFWMVALTNGMLLLATCGVALFVTVYLVILGFVRGEL